jgi:hypothetical protein
MDCEFAEWVDHHLQPIDKLTSSNRGDLSIKYERGNFALNQQKLTSIHGDQV